MGLYPEGQRVPRNILTRPLELSPMQPVKDDAIGQTSPLARDEDPEEFWEEFAEELE